MDPTPAEVEAALKVAHFNLWARGDLRYLAHETQLKIRHALEANTRRKFFLLCSRRLGKSHLLVTLAFECAIKKPGARVLFLAPTAKQASEIAVDIAHQVLKDCPSALRPEYLAQAKEFHFPNGSIVRLKGVNGEHHQDLRGTAMDLIVLDECALMDSLDSVVSSVCMPMLLTTNGRLILATTPPESPGHDSAQIYEGLAASQSAVKFTLTDAPESHIPFATKVEYLIEAGESPEEAPLILFGKLKARTTTALREYFCEFVTDASKAVIPEFLRAETQVVREHPRPEFFDSYVALDPGFEDKTGIVFGYWDFLCQRLVIEDEILLHRANTKDIADAIRAKEKALWGDRVPFVRVCDVDLRLVADLRILHGLDFQTARKEDSLGAINLLRTDVQAGRLSIDPRCVHTIRQFRNAIWNNKATDFARAGENSPDGHYDLLAATKYLCRTVQRNRNPYPDHYYQVGGRLGPPQGSWISPKSRKRPTLGLHADTPLGRRLAGLKKKA